MMTIEEGRKILKEQLMQLTEILGVSESVKKVSDFLAKEIYKTLYVEHKDEYNYFHFYEFMDLHDFKINQVKAKKDILIPHDSISINTHYDNSSKTVSLLIEISSSKKYTNENDLKIDLYHEINHAFEEYNKLNKGKEDKPLNKNIYTISNTFLKTNPNYKSFNYYVYLSDPKENNAFVSELFEKIRQTGKFETTEDFVKFLKDQDIYKKVEEMINFDTSKYLSGLKTDDRFRSMVNVYMEELNEHNKINLKNEEETIIYFARRFKISGEYLRRKLMRLRTHPDVQ